MVEINLLKTEEETTVEEFNYMPAWVFRDDLPGKSTFYIVPVAFYEKNTTFFNFKDHDKYKINLFSTDTREHLKNVKESDFFKTN
jgi:hypothetical protein